jgi:catechol 2,3-dioxygenase-like lactoylglutathione lyase family enzyme
MSVPARINIVTLGVGDLDRSSSFYEALGWRRADSSNEEICWFQTGGAYLGLFPFAALAADAALPAERRSGFAGVTLAINVESEDEVTRALDAAVAVGATLLKAAERAEWGGFSGYFADPDGYAWEVAFNPSFVPDAGGAIEIP